MPFRMTCQLFAVAAACSWAAGAMAVADDCGPPRRNVKKTWYDTRSIGHSPVEQKKTMEIDAKRALKIFDTSDNGIADDWQSHLPQQVLPAARVAHMPRADGITRHAKEPGRMEIHILGFDDDRVHVMLARHVGHHLWHRYKAVEADLMVQRSRKVDDLLDLDEFTRPFTRTVRGIHHATSRKKVHETLGLPDASRFTQSSSLKWDYYFAKGLTIQYQPGVFRIMDRVPESIRNRTTRNPHVKYRKPAEPQERQEMRLPSLTPQTTGAVPG